MAWLFRKAAAKVLEQMKDDDEHKCPDCDKVWKWDDLSKTRQAARAVILSKNLPNSARVATGTAYLPDNAREICSDCLKHYIV